MKAGPTFAAAAAGELLPSRWNIRSYIWSHLRFSRWGSFGCRLTSSDHLHRRDSRGEAPLTPYHHGRVKKWERNVVKIVQKPTWLRHRSREPKFCMLGTVWNGVTPWRSRQNRLKLIRDVLVMTGNGVMKIDASYCRFDCTNGSFVHTNFWLFICSKSEDRNTNMYVDCIGH